MNFSVAHLLHKVETGFFVSPGWIMLVHCQVWDPSAMEGFVCNDVWKRDIFCPVAQRISFNVKGRGWRRMISTCREDLFPSLLCHLLLSQAVVCVPWKSMLTQRE